MLRPCLRWQIFISLFIIRHIVTHKWHSISKVLVQKLLNSWGLDRFEKHLKEVQNFYMARRDVMVSLVEKHLTGKRLTLDNCFALFINCVALKLSRAGRMVGSPGGHVPLDKTDDDWRRLRHGDGQVRLKRSPRHTWSRFQLRRQCSGSAYQTVLQLRISGTSWRGEYMQHLFTYGLLETVQTCFLSGCEKSSEIL